MTWFSLPLGFVGDAAELGRMMEAQERVMTIDDMGAATGNVRRHARTGHIRDLKRAARGKRRRQKKADEPVVVTPKTKAEAQAEFAAFGIQVVKEADA